jgi:hypothetical protein
MEDMSAGFTVELVHAGEYSPTFLTALAGILCVRGITESTQHFGRSYLTRGYTVKG